MMRDTRFALLGVREGIGQPDARVTSSPVANPAGGESVASTREQTRVGLAGAVAFGPRAKPGRHRCEVVLPGGVLAGGAVASKHWDGVALPLDERDRGQAVGGHA